MHFVHDRAHDRANTILILGDISSESAKRKDAISESRAQHTSTVRSLRGRDRSRR